QETFGHYLTDHAPTTRSKRRPHRHSPLPRHASRQQQVGHVSTGNQQCASGRTEQHQQRGLHVTRDFFVHPHHYHRPVLLPLRIVRLHPLLDGSQFGCCLFGI